MRHGPWRTSRAPRVLDPGRAVRAARGRPRDCRSRPRPSRWHRIVRRAKAGAAYAFEALEDRADTASPKGAARGTPRDAGRRGGDHRRAVTNLNATPSIPPGMCPNVAWCPRSASAQANRADAQVPRCTGPASTIAYACRRLRATRRVRRAVAPAVSGRPGPLIECRLPWAPVAQLDRVPGFEPGGRGFESLRARQSCHKIQCLNRHAATQRRASRLRDCDAGVGKTPTLPAANDVSNRTTLQRGHCGQVPVVRAQSGVAGHPSHTAAFLAQRLGERGLRTVASAGLERQHKPADSMRPLRDPQARVHFTAREIQLKSDE